MAKKTDTTKDDAVKSDVEGFLIRAVPAQGFRRAGIAFTREGIGIACSALTDEQIELLRNEPNLVVEEATFSDQEPA